MTVSTMMTSTLAATDETHDDGCPTFPLRRPQAQSGCRSASTSTSITSSQMIPQITMNDHSSQLSWAACGPHRRQYRLPTGAAGAEQS